MTSLHKVYDSTYPLCLLYCVCMPLVQPWHQNLSKPATGMQPCQHAPSTTPVAATCACCAVGRRHCMLAACSSSLALVPATDIKVPNQPTCKLQLMCIEPSSQALCHSDVVHAPPTTVTLLVQQCMLLPWRHGLQHCTVIHVSKSMPFRMACSLPMDGYKAKQVSAAHACALAKPLSQPASISHLVHPSRGA